MLLASYVSLCCLSNGFQLPRSKGIGFVSNLPGACRWLGLLLYIYSNALAQIRIQVSLPVIFVYTLSILPTVNLLSLEFKLDDIPQELTAKSQWMWMLDHQLGHQHQAFQHHQHQTLCSLLILLM